jgi:hypothetical protein
MKLVDAGSVVAESLAEARPSGADLVWADPELLLSA